MTPLNVLQHLNTAHIYHNYEHLAYGLYKHKAKHQAQMITKPKKGCPPKLLTLNKNTYSYKTI